jgi:hypothetical protein
VDRQDIIRSWAPTVLCAFNVGVATYYYTGGNAGVWTSVIISMPMCFFFVSAAFYQMFRKLRDLQREIEELRGASKAQ